MNKKFISVFMISAATLATLGTVTSCKDYDDDIKDLQEQIDGTKVDVAAEISRLEAALATSEAACAQAQSDLAQAIKDATNDAKGYADIQINAAKASVLETAKQEIGDAVNALKEGDIKTAQAKANDAYSLAQQANTLAGENKGKIDKLTTQLGETTIAIGEVKDLAVRNETDITSLKTQLENLEKANDLAHDALSQKDDELKKLIEKNQESIKNLLEVKIPKIEEDIRTNAEDIDKNERAISNLKSEMNKVNGYLFSNLNNLITGLIFQDEQLEIVQAKVQDDGSNGFNYTGDASLRLLDAAGTLHFPYINAINETTLVPGQWNVERVAGPVYYTINPTEVNFTDKANIKLENSLANAPVGIDISAPEASKRLSSIATRATGNTKNGLYQSTIINSKNHLTAPHEGFKTYDAAGKPNAAGNSFALYTKYEQTDVEGKIQEKKVYSQYALNIYVEDAGVQLDPKINAIKPDVDAPRFGDVRFTAKYGEPMKGMFQLTPINTEFGKSDPLDHKVYQKYIDIIEVHDARNVPQSTQSTASFKKLDQLKKALRDANPDVLNTIFEEDNDNFDTIVINCPDNTTLSNGTSYNFIGSTVTFRYYIQNYNGTIYSKDIMVMFAKELFKENKVTFVHAPYQKGENLTFKYEEGRSDFMNLKGVKNGTRILTFDATAFRTQANCIADKNSDKKVITANKLWSENTDEIKFILGSMFTDKTAITRIDFYQKGLGWSLIKSTTPDASNNQCISGLTVADMQKVTDIVIAYDPAKLIPEDKVYTMEMKSYDMNGNYVATLPIEFTMKYPWHCSNPALIKPNPAFFTPYNRDMTVEDITKDVTLTAWANEHVTVDAANNIYNATYNLIAAFNAPYYASDGCVIRFDYTSNFGDKDKAYPCNDKSGYVGSNVKPVTTCPIFYSSSAADYKMEVPSQAVKFKNEHAYKMQVQVENYGVPSLWWRPYEFNMKYKSAIAYATATADVLAGTGAEELFKWSNAGVFTVGYPTKTLKIGDNNITTDDPSTSWTDDINYFGANQDDRILEITGELVEKQFGSLFKTIKIDNGGIEITTNENVPGGAASITSDKIKFNMYVKDYFGNTITRPFWVKVDANM